MSWGLDSMGLCPDWPDAAHLGPGPLLWPAEASMRDKKTKVEAARAMWPVGD